jgi:hypothetical protein
LAGGEGRPAHFLDHGQIVMTKNRIASPISY